MLLANGGGARDNAAPMRNAKRTAARECLIKGCARPVWGHGLCKTHLARSKPRPDGSIPTPAEIAGLVPKPAPRKNILTTRVDDATLARLKKGVAMKRAKSVHGLLCRLAAEYSPEADKGPPRPPPGKP